ncbi:MAG: MarC family protein [Pseudomonadota bacterium]
MNNYPLVFTILFLLVGPLKTIRPFADATRDLDRAFQRSIAIHATIIAAVLVAFVALAGSNLLVKYQVSIGALRLAAALVLLLSALRTMFVADSGPARIVPGTSPLQAAAAPISSPIVVTPAGVAAILIFAMLSPTSPGMMQDVGVSLAIIIPLNFLVMYFNRWIVGRGLLMLALQLLGEVLVFVQVAMAVEIMLMGLRGLGVIAAAAGLP